MKLYEDYAAAKNVLLSEFGCEDTWYSIDGLVDVPWAKDRYSIYWAEPDDKKEGAFLVYSVEDYTGAKWETDTHVMYVTDSGIGAGEGLQIFDKSFEMPFSDFEEKYQNYM